MKKHTKLIAAIVIIVGLATFGAGLWKFQLQENIHTVINGQIYRSAELSQESLQKLIDERHIKTIINLEGSSDQAWYLDEIAAAKKNNIRHYNMELNAHHLPSVAQLRYLTHLLQTAPRPILIHCHRGSDRTGLASAMAVILANEPLSRARQQYSWRYLVVSPSSVGKQVIPLYQHWLQEKKLPSNRENFLRWLQQLQPVRHTPSSRQTRADRL